MKKNDSKINNSLKLIVKTSFFVFFGLLISKLLTYAYRIIIARFYGPEIYGLFLLSLIVLSWTITFSSFGLSDGLLRFIPIYRGKNQDKKIKYMVNFVLFTLLISSIFFSILLFIFADPISINLFKNLKLSIFIKFFALLLPISVISNVFLVIIRAYEKIGAYTFFVNILQNLIKLILIILLILVGFNSNSIIYSYLIGAILLFIISFIYIKYRLPLIFGISKISNKEKKQLKYNLINYSWPLMFSGVFVSLLYWIDSISIGYFIDATSVGIYNAAIPIISLFILVQEIFMQLLFPLINREYSQKNLILIREITKQVSKWILILDLPLFLFILLFPSEIINILFGSQYLESSNTLIILSIGAFASFLIPILNNLISMMGKSKLLLYNLIIATIFNLALNSILIPLYGIQGAAIATTIVSILMVITLLIETKILTNIIPLRKKMLSISLLSLIPFSIVYFTKNFFDFSNIFILISFLLVFILIYIIALFIFKGLDKNDKMIFDSLVSKISSSVLNKIK